MINEKADRDSPEWGMCKMWVNNFIMQKCRRRLLLQTLESVLALYRGSIKEATGTRAASPTTSFLSESSTPSTDTTMHQQHLEDIAGRVCGTGALDLLADALLLCEEEPSMEHAKGIESLCLEIVSLVTETEVGCKALVGSEIPRAECVRWMVVRKFGEEFYGAGLLERMQTLIPTDEEFNRLCPR